MISYVTDGIGHRRAAEAVDEAVHQRLPDAEVHCVDLLSRCPALVRRGYPSAYRTLVRWFPSCWAIGYYGLDQPAVFGVAQLGRRAWNLAVSQEFQRWVRDLRPDVTVATHFFPADVFDAGKQHGWLTGRLIVAITDLFPHRIWLAKHADAFVVGSELTRTWCQARGIRADRIHPLGIPIAGVFGDLPDRLSAKQRLGLDARRRAVLIASGGMGFGPIRELTRRLASTEQARAGRLQLLVVCGGNEALAEVLRREAAGLPMPVHIYGFVTNIHEMMAASELYVTKPGGLAIMEALAAGLPMVLTGAIPGQERFNANYVISQGAAVPGTTVRDVIAQVLSLLDDPATLEAMASRARALSKPHAAAALVDHLIK